jgi:DNA polymerase delta subunit 4
MATTSGNIKGFYRQRKNSGVTKSSSNTKKASKPSSLKRSPKDAATFGSDVTQPTALLSHGSPDLKGLSLSLSLSSY